MDEKLKSKCFVCQSNFKSADGNSSEKRRRKTDNYDHSLDSSTWKMFCHYFFPTPLVGLFDSCSPDFPENTNKIKKDSSFIPEFCGVCCQTILKLCSLHNQLELIQCQISKIVVQVSLTFLQKEEKVQNNNRWCEAQQTRKKVHQRLDDNVIYSMRSCIRQRYQPLIRIKRCNTDILNHKSGGSSIKNSEIAEQFSPLSKHSNSSALNHDLDFNVDLSHPIKQEVEDSPHTIIKDDDEEPKSPKRLNYDEVTNQHNSDLFSESIKGAISLDKKTSRLRSRRRIANYGSECSETDDGCHSDQDSKSDSDFEPHSDDEDKLVYEKQVSLPKFKIKINPDPKTKKGKRSPCDKSKIVISKKLRNSLPGPTETDNKDFSKATTDVEVGDNIFEYGGQCRYEKKLDKNGTSLIFCCLSCSKTCTKRFLLIRHIKRLHIKDEQTPAGQRKQRTLVLDDNNFIYDGIYPITKVTEPNGVFFKCGTCQSLKNTMNSVITHLKETHIEPRKYICEKCGYGCSQRIKLQEHMETHAEDRKYICETCGKSFRTRWSLAGHRGIHSGSPCVCECGAQFKYSSSLRRHRRKANHQAPKVGLTNAPKTCSLCKKIFVREENFQKHSSMCQGMSPCDWCGKRCLLTKLQTHKRFRCRERFMFGKNVQKSTDSANIDLKNERMSFDVD